MNRHSSCKLLLEKGEYCGEGERERQALEETGGFVCELRSYDRCGTGQAVHKLRVCGGTRAPRMELPGFNLAKDFLKGFAHANSYPIIQN